MHVIRGTTAEHLRMLFTLSDERRAASFIIHDSVWRWLDYSLEKQIRNTWNESPNYWNERLRGIFFSGVKLRTVTQMTMSSDGSISSRIALSWRAQNLRRRFDQTSDIRLQNSDLRLTDQFFGVCVEWRHWWDVWRNRTDLRRRLCVDVTKMSRITCRRRSTQFT